MVGIVRGDWSRDKRRRRKTVLMERLVVFRWWKASRQTVDFRISMVRWEQLSYTGEGRWSGWEGDLDSLSGGGSRCHVQRLKSITGRRAPE